MSPIEVDPILRTALRHLQTGQLAQAETLCRQILTQYPDHDGALHWLGVVALQGGRHDLAVEYFGRACALRPDVGAYHGNLGNALMGLGKHDEAVASYRQALVLKPDLAEAHNTLGNALMAQGKPGEAIASYRRALELKPGYAETHNNLGNALKSEGKPDEAVASYRRALDLKPDYAVAHNNLGNALKEVGSLDEAIEHYRRALATNPAYAEAHDNLGNALYDTGKTDEAIANFRRALELKPNYAEAHNHLGQALHGRGKFVEAVASIRRALELQPGSAETHNNLGNALHDLGKLDEAIASYRRALALKPGYAEAYGNLGATLYDQRKLGEAEACHRRALELKPDYAEAHNNLGNVLHDRGKLDDAVASYRRALALKPGYAEANFNLGASLHDQGKLDEAVASYRRALELKPGYTGALCNLIHQLQQICQWGELSELSQRVLDIIDADAGGVRAELVSPFLLLALPILTTVEQQFRCAQRWANGLAKTSRAVPFERPAKRSPKITVGYLSADFRVHAIAILVSELIEKHDRGRFEIIGYSYGPDDGSPMRQRLVRAFDRFVDIKDASFEEAARRIAADGVDILVGLQGYTKDSRTEIFVDRPAPIQVNYLGYPGTMGASFMDYILVDDVIVPPDRQPFYAEKLVHLPGCYQVNDSQRAIAPETPSKTECGLPEEGFVFCSFNNNYKITVDIFGVWMRILSAAPGSVLWLLEDNRFAPVNLRREAHARGVAPERLVFAPRCPAPEHLARHRHADLFLDTLPYNAHVTASDALWAGCPLLTITGETFPSRVAASLLRAVGLPELITTSFADYEALAVRLARDSRLLGDLRARLAVNRTTAPVFSAEPFARNIEKAYATMWNIYVSGEPPRSFAVVNPEE